MKPTYDELLKRIKELEQSKMIFEEDNAFPFEVQQFAQLGWWKFDIASDTMIWSDNVNNILGITQKDVPLSFELMIERIHPDYQEYYKRQLALLLEKGSAIFEYPILRPDGDTAWIWGEGKLKHNQNGILTHMFGFVQDITHQKKIEEELRDSDERYRAIFHNSPLGIFRSTFQGQFIEVNEALSKMLGYESPQKVIEDIHNIGEQIYVNAGERREIVSTMLNQNSLLHAINHYRRKDGTVFIANLYLKTILDVNNQPLYLEGIVEDITESQKAEENLRYLIKEIEIREKIVKICLSSSLENVFFEIIGLLVNEFNCSFGYYGHVDESNNWICSCITKIGFSNSNDLKQSVFYPRKSWGSLWSKMLTRKKPFLSNKRFDLPNIPVLFENVLTVPLKESSRIIGHVLIANKNDEFADNDILRLESLSNYIIPIMEIFLEKENTKKSLQRRSKELEEKNIALNVLLESRENEKKKLLESILNNFEKLVFPYYERLKSCKSMNETTTLLGIVESNTKESLSPLEKTFPSIYRTLTPMEIQVADLIKAGKTSKEISLILNKSASAIFFHRNNIRKKLNIHCKKANLRAYLLSLPPTQ